MARKIVNSLELIVNSSKKRAFTLIELLVVVAIIGILVSIVAVSAFRAKNQSHISQAKTDINRMVVSYDSYKAAHLTTSVNLGSVGNPPVTNADSAWQTFWQTIGAQSFNPSSGSGITYEGIVLNNGYVFCAIGGDLDNTVVSGRNSEINPTGTDASICSSP